MSELTHKEIRVKQDLKEFEKDNVNKLKCEKISSKSVVIVDPEYFDVEPEGDAEHLPDTAKKLYGCRNCEFKNWICPFKFKNKNQYHSNGICNFRINYLLSFTRSNKVKPRYSEWQRDFNLGLAQVKMLHEYKRMQQIQQELFEMEEDGEKLDFARQEELLKEQKTLRIEWMDLWKTITKFEDRQVDRDTAKKLEITNEKKITLHQIHEIMSEGEGIKTKEVIDIAAD